MYSIERNRSDGVATWKDINVPVKNGAHINLTYISLLYDGNTDIFLSDFNNKAVRVFSVNGQYNYQLLSSRHITNSPCILAIDKQSQLLHVRRARCRRNAGV